MRKKIILVVGIVLVNIAIFACNNFNVYENATQQYSIYEKVNVGISYEEFVNILDEKKIGYELKNDQLNIYKLKFDITDKEKVQIVENRRANEFKTIDERGKNVKVTVSYDKNGNKQEKVQIANCYYINGEYFRLRSVPFLIYSFSLGAILVILLTFIKDNNFGTKKRRKKKVKNG